MDFLRNFINFMRPRVLGGLTFNRWQRLLRENNYDINVKYLPRIGVISILSWMNSIFKLVDDHRYGSLINKVKVDSPIFIMGAMRTGTTFLRNIMCNDERFAFPNLYQACYPSTFLSTEYIVTRLTKNWIAKNRHVDNVVQSWSVPSEDEYAILAISQRSPYIGNIFPKNQQFYERYFTFLNVQENDIIEWKIALKYFLKKLSLKYQRPLLLKSPPHTGRLHLLLEMFPDAKFILIHRDPYELFQSAKNHYQIISNLWRLQNNIEQDVDGLIINRYKNIYASFFKYKECIKDGNLYSISFNELKQNPSNVIEKIYQELDLPDFKFTQYKMDRYIKSISGYQQNIYPTFSTTLRNRIRREWSQYIDYWEYS